MDIDDLLSVSHVQSHLESYDEAEDVLVNGEHGEHVFEVIVEEKTDEIEAKLEAHLNQYGPTITSEVREDGRPYYRIEITGLADH